MAKLAGKWNMVKTENFEEYMKAVGMLGSVQLVNIEHNLVTL